MQDKLRVGIVIDERFHPETGGGFSYYDSLLNAINEHEFDPLLEFVFVRFSEGKRLTFKKEFLQFTFDETIPEEEHCKKRIEQINKIPILFIKQHFRKRYESRIPILREKKATERKNKLEEWFISNRIDILYYLTPKIPETNFPFLTTHWDIGHYSMYAFPEVSMNGIFENRENLYEHAYKKALVIFCESQIGKKELIRYKQINPNRIMIVPLIPGKLIELEVPVLKQNAIIEYLGLKKDCYFLYPAQFWAHKNHYHLLLAFKKVLQIYPDLKLVLPGSDKGNLEYVKDLIQNLHLDASVLIPGFISDEALYSLYKNAVSLVMPTFLGPTNMPLLEAAFLGCPVITSAFEGHKEMLGDYATYIDPLDRDQIADAMIKQYNEKKKVKKLFKNHTNNINSAIAATEKNFLLIRKIRKTWGNNSKNND